jgi:hypothetical protein
MIMSHGSDELGEVGADKADQHSHQYADSEARPVHCRQKIASYVSCILFYIATGCCNCVRRQQPRFAMTLTRGKLANIDRRLLAELTDEEGSQPSRLPISPATWSAWNRYCDVVGIPMGRAIVAMIRMELASVVDEDLDAESAVIAEKKRLLDERTKELDAREREIERREKRLEPRHRPSKAELERMADQIEPTDPGWAISASASTNADPELFKGVGRNEKCPCGSDKKFKACHWDWYRQQT